MSAPLPVRPEISEESIAFREAMDAQVRGWAVIPADPLSKRPLFNWKGFQKHPPTEGDLMCWKDQPAFAVITGETSGVIVLDVDPGGEKALRDRELPDTVIAKTPRGGLHFYYCHPGYKIPTKNNIFGKNSHVDIRGDGGIALLPGSEDRRWKYGKCPGEIKLADLPKWLLDTLIKGHRGYKTSKNIITCPSHPSSPVIPISPVQGDVLARWAKDDRFIQAAIDQLGIEKKRNRAVISLRTA